MSKDFLLTRAPESVSRSRLRGIMLAATTFLFISALLAVASLLAGIVDDPSEEVRMSVEGGSATRLDRITCHVGHNKTW